MSSFFKDFFYFSRGERRGIVFLLILAIMLGFLPWLLPYFVHKEVFPKESFDVVEKMEEEPPVTTTDSTAISLFYFDPNTLSKDSFLLLGLSDKTAQTILNYRTKVSSFNVKEDFKKIYTLKVKDYEKLAPFIQIKQGNHSNNSQRITPEKPSYSLKEFNPNTATKEELLALGLSPKVCKTLINFRKKGGRFYEKQDLKLIYGLRSIDYDRLEPFIEISKKIPPSTDTSKQKSIPHQPNTIKTAANITIDINKASPEEWQQLYGIGPAYAKRIVNFRDKLGGFSGIEQVAKTYGLPDSTFQNIKSHLIASPIFRLININIISSSELKKHPLIKWKEAKMIINYRDQHGPFLLPSDLLKMKGIPKEKIEALIPYFYFE